MFDDTFKHFNYLYNNLYIIKYKITHFNKESILLKCAEKNCNIKAKINYISNDNIGYPDEEGNILYDNNNNFFSSEVYIIKIEFHKSFVKDFIFKNYSNIIKKDIFNNNPDNIYLKEYCKKYFLENPDVATDLTLEILSNKFNITKDSELVDLYKSIKIGKQYIYDHPSLIPNYIFNLEDISDNNNNKICTPYPYILNNKQKKILWLILDEDMKKTLQIKRKFWKICNKSILL